MDVYTPIDSSATELQSFSRRHSPEKGNPLGVVTDPLDSGEHLRKIQKCSARIWIPTFAGMTLWLHINLIAFHVEPFTNQLPQSCICGDRWNMARENSIREKYRKLFPVMTERSRRTWAAAE